MKVRIDSDASAQLFNCAIGDTRGLERNQALALIKTGDVSEVTEDEATPAKKAPAKKARTSR
jgi:hypothetical protein